MRLLLLALLATCACGRGGFEPLLGLALDQASLISASDSATFTGTCRVGVVVSTSGSIIDCSSGRFSYTVSASSDGPTSVTFAQAGVSVTGMWIRDTTGPVLQAETAMIGGGTSASVRFPQLHVHAIDAYSNVAALCVKTDDTAAPATSDSCWITTNGAIIREPTAIDLTVDDLPTELGFLAGSYITSIWAEDALGNVSTLRQQAGADTLALTYSPTPPPVVTNLYATQSDSPSTPPTLTDTTIAAGADVFIRWSVTDDAPLPASAIALYWTTDDTTYTPIVTGLDNAAHGCFAPTPYTGCYVWAGGATAGYFRVRLLATDAQGFVTATSSTPVNSAPLEVVAGNYDAGLGGSATAAMFIGYFSAGTRALSQSMVLARDGSVYFRDQDRGILAVDPRDGVVRVLIPNAATSSDGGFATATVGPNLYNLTVDAQDRLWVVDGALIRRIDLVARTITTIIGGGTSTADTAPALDVAIDPGSAPRDHTSQLVVLPNGDVWFQSDNYSKSTQAGNRIRVYDHGSEMVRTIRLSGTGDVHDPTTDLTACLLDDYAVAYDPATGTVTALIAFLQHTAGLVGCGNEIEFTRLLLDPQTGAKIGEIAEFSPWDADHAPVTARTGDVYLVSPNRGIHHYNGTSGAFEQLAGQVGEGDCDDGTALASCAVEPQDAFVDTSGQLAFMTRDRLRVVDRGGIVRTLVGQQVSYGDGGAPASARFGEIDVVQPRNGGSVVLDLGSGTFRQIDAATVTRVAGNGTNNVPTGTVPATQEGILYNSSGNLWPSFATDPATGDIYYNTGYTSAGRLDASGAWVTFLGNPSATVDYDTPAANGLDGTQIRVAPSGYDAVSPRVLGFGNGEVVVALQIYTFTDFTDYDSWYMRYPAATNKQAALVGSNGLSTYNWCAVGTPLSSCNAPIADAQSLSQLVYTSGSGWVGMYQGVGTMRAMPEGGSMQAYYEAQTPPSGLAISASGGTVAYCSTTTGHIHSYVFAAGVETELPWPVPSIACTGIGMYFDASGALVVPFRSGHLWGVVKHHGAFP